MSRGFTDDGLAALDAVLAGHVALGGLPGLVALVARDDTVHVATVGNGAFDDDRAIGRDAIFRIASMTKPITGVAAMTLVEDGSLTLDDPIGRWIPELARPRVLATLASELDDTVPADRPITVEDVLSFRLGFGVILDPGPYPIQAAVDALGLRTLGPPWPPVDLTPDQWIARFATLPLLDQPGERWRYNTGATVAGVLIERVAGAPLADVLHDRVLGPLGMDDTGFHVPSGKLARFATYYAGDGASGAPVVLDRPDGWWAHPPALPDASSWLVSTIDDLWAFASMLAADGGDVLTADSVRLMTRDRTTAADRRENRLILGDHTGWGLLIGVPASDGSLGVPASDGSLGVPHGYGWDGGSGTTWRTDPTTGLTGILLTQRAMDSPEPPALMQDFWAAAYAALDD